MKLYKVSVVVDDCRHIRWAGTQSDSKKARQELADTNSTSKSYVEIEEVEIATNKPGLLKFLSMNVAIAAVPE